MLRLFRDRSCGERRFTIRNMDTTTASARYPAKRLSSMCSDVCFVVLQTLIMLGFPGSKHDGRRDEAVPRSADSGRLRFVLRCARDDLQTTFVTHLFSSLWKLPPLKHPLDYTGYPLCGLCEYIIQLTCPLAKHTIMRGLRRPYSRSNVLKRQPQT